jgi:hypothetical protein
MTAQYDTEDEDARRDSLEAQARFDRIRQELRANAGTHVQSQGRNSTSTRQPDNQDYQDFQESQDLQESQVHQDLYEVPIGTDTNAVSKGEEPEEHSELFKRGDYSAIPERDFLLLAWQESEGKNWQDDGVSETWEFCRYLRAHPEFESLAPPALVRKLRSLIDLEEGYLETISAEIIRVRIAKGGGPLDYAIGMADQYPITDPEDLRLERYNRFLSIAGWLQVEQGSKPVYLPVEKLAKLMNVTPRAVSTWRAIAQRQGLLKEVPAYERHKKATEFRFAVERFGVFRERGNL